MEYIAQCLERFRKLPRELKELFGGPDAMESILEIEERYRINTSFVVVLVAIGDLSVQDVASYLQLKHGLSEEDAVEISSILLREIFSLALLLPGKEFDGITEAKEKLLDLLSDPQAAENFNQHFFSSLTKRPELLAELENALLNHPIKIGEKKIISGKGSAQPTLANWIKDFAAASGAGNFDELVLAHYLSDSPNASQLAEADKIILGRALRFYRNVAYFDEITDKKPVKLWNFIPLETTHKEDPAPLPERKSISRPIQEKPEPEIVPAEESQASKLQAALNDYPSDSLEYKVIKQELDRLRMTAAVKN
ncbi:MAG: hypothetical protein ACM3PZ_02240 [Bacillota bacterium]